jgi:hypothetical protein
LAANWCVLVAEHIDGVDGFGANTDHDCADHDHDCADHDHDCADHDHDCADHDHDCADHDHDDCRTFDVFGDV